MTQKIQLSGKVGDIILVVGGDTPAEFGTNLAGMVPQESIDDILNLFAKAFDPLAKAEQAVTQAFSQPTAPAPTAASTPAPSAEGPKTETDKFNRTFTYGLDDAPSCPHGQRVMMDATSKAGKPYKAWVCPTHSPAAYRQKVQKDDNCKMEFCR